MKARINSDLLCRHRFVLVALIIALALFACGFVWTCKDRVVFEDNGRITEVNAYNNNGSVEANLKVAGINLGTGDEYRITGKSWMGGTTVKIYRAVPLTVVYRGEARQVMCGKPTVKELVQAIHPQGKYRVSADESARPQAGMTVKIVAIDEKVVEKTRPVKFDVVNTPDAAMEKGQTVIDAAGADGSERAKVREIYEDGVLVDVTTLEKKEISKPVAQKQRVGTRDTVETSRGAMRFRSTAQMVASAYTEADGPGGGYTATGLRARRGVVAVDPDVIPLGTRLYIEGYGLAVAGDTGGAIRGNRIDLCMDHHYEAVNYGRQYVKVYILE